jgi:hypothetical protein
MAHMNIAHLEITQVDEELAIVAINNTIPALVNLLELELESLIVEPHNAVRGAIASFEIYAMDDNKKKALPLAAAVIKSALDYHLDGRGQISVYIANKGEAA